MLFGKLLPHGGHVFKLFNQDGDFIVSRAPALTLFIQSDGDLELREQYANKVDTAERQADRITVEVNRLLLKTFITPIDREQIHGLINAMDEILGVLQDGSKTMSLYNVRAMTENIPRLGDISAKCCERVQRGCRCCRGFVRSKPPKRRSRPARRSTGSSRMPTA